MPDVQVFYGELQKRKRSQDGQNKLYKYTLKALIEDFNTSVRGTGCIESSKLALPRPKKEQISTQQRESVKLKETYKRKSKADGSS